MSFLLNVISNAGPLMALGKLNRLDLLALLFETVRIPEAVYDEVVTRLAHGEPDARLVRDFWQLNRWPVEPVSLDQIGSLNLQAQLGKGEQAVLALALPQRFPLALIDDSVARSEAHRLGIRVTGTLGILVQAYRQQYLDFDEAAFLIEIEEVAQRPDIWISDTICKQVLEGLRNEAD